MMRAVTVLLGAFTLAACAGRPATMQAAPDLAGNAYEFEGRFEDRMLTGTVRFVAGDATLPLEYTISSEAGVCRAQLRRVSPTRTTIGCGGITLELLNAGAVVDRANASWRTVSTVVRRECRVWSTQSGQRVCTSWDDVPVEQSAVLRGVVAIRQL